ncbi:hypothetical protein SLEP1_g33999 [Rubroshorea leprosula]|uniref:Uncharacterized protein n=1 Tax=Rubroshorea leprosula TaxID=152421 RepID=A0AAV5KID7_9ROSI|nr:hypothetical protein SLEP1_g33999 [Rubroshorea leprosula]
MVRQLSFTDGINADILQTRLNKNFTRQDSLREKHYLRNHSVSCVRNQTSLTKALHWETCTAPRSFGYNTSCLCLQACIYY